LAAPTLLLLPLLLHHAFHSDTNRDSTGRLLTISKDCIDIIIIFKLMIGEEKQHL
jgi:hypothetical protein